MPNSMPLGPGRGLRRLALGQPWTVGLELRACQAIGRFHTARSIVDRVPAWMYHETTAHMQRLSSWGGIRLVPRRWAALGTPVLYGSTRIYPPDGVVAEFCRYSDGVQLQKGLSTDGHEGLVPSTERTWCLGSGSDWDWPGAAKKIRDAASE